jgi:hypothetical protein
LNSSQHRLEQISEVVAEQYGDCRGKCVFHEELAAQAEMLNDTVIKYKVNSEG